jgi:hypothetical protein
MKSEERHQLHEHALAASLERGLAKVEPYSNQILLGILVAALVGIGLMLWVRSSGSRHDLAWADYNRAVNADDFLTVADDHRDSPVAPWARLRAGELYLGQGLQVATSDSKTYEERLKNAETAFEVLVNEKDIAPEIRERAVYGLAVTREGLSSGDTSSAITAYEELITQYEGSPYVGLAKERIAALKHEPTQEFYAWFQRQTRKPDERPEPRDLPSERDTGTAAPFVWNSDQPPATSANPDRPPSPDMPRPAGDAGTVPVDDAATDPASAAEGEAGATTTTDPAPETTPETPATTEESPGESTTGEVPAEGTDTPASTPTEGASTPEGTPATDPPASNEPPVE